MVSITLVFNTRGQVTFDHAVAVPDDAYASGWNGSANVPTKNAVYDKIELILGTTLPATYQPLDSEQIRWPTPSDPIHRLRLRSHQQAVLWWAQRMLTQQLRCGRLH